MEADWMIFQPFVYRMGKVIIINLKYENVLDAQESFKNLEKFLKQVILFNYGNFMLEIKNKKIKRFSKLIAIQIDFIDENIAEKFKEYFEQEISK